MPDDDRFPRYLSPAERVGDAVTKAVAATIRTVHGIPSLPTLAERMREAAAKGDSLRDCLNKTDQWQGIVSEFPPIMDVECVAPAQLTRLYGAYVREWEAVDLASFRLRSDRSAALCETKIDQS